MDILKKHTPTWFPAVPTIYEKDEGSISTLAVERLHKSFGDKKILSDLSLHVNEGDIYGFVGSNGAGKSTTMRIIIGVLLPDSGEAVDIPLVNMQR